MSVRSEGSNAPLRKPDKKRIEDIKKRTEQLTQIGLSKDEAEAQAHQEARDNNTGDWRK